jgi:hypothetical protein
MRRCRCSGLTLCAQCTALAERAGVLTPPAPPAVSEKAFMAAVVRLAREAGFLCYHTFDSRRSPSGFMDLVLARAGSPLYAVEVKTDVGTCTKAQEAWLAALAGSTGVETGVWRPSMWSEIVEQLRG